MIIHWWLLLCQPIISHYWSLFTDTCLLLSALSSKWAIRATKLPILWSHLICWVNKITISVHCKHSWWLKYNYMDKMSFDIHRNKCVFIRPFEKRTYYAMAMSVRLSIRPSVRPSIRPSVRVFRTFFSTCFEISIWNLVYAFSRWHDMSSLSFITIGSLWPSLQPKVGQTQFLLSWPYKSR